MKKQTNFLLTRTISVSYCLHFYNTLHCKAENKLKFLHITVVLVKMGSFLLCSIIILLSHDSCSCDGQELPDSERSGEPVGRSTEGKDVLGSVEQRLESESVLRFQALKEFRIKQVTEYLRQALDLKDLNLTEVSGDSNASDRIAATDEQILPSVVLDEVQSNARQQEIRDSYNRERKAIVPGKDMGRMCAGLRATGCYKFNFNGQVNGEVSSVTLLFYKTQEWKDGTGQQFKVFELERRRRLQTLRPMNPVAREDTFIEEGWVTVNVTRPVRRWLEEGRDGGMLAIRCETCETRNHTAIFGAKHEYTPLLVLEYADTVRAGVPRAKRDASLCSGCCAKDLYVYPMILARHDLMMIHPRTINIGFCAGVCESEDFMSEHTGLKEMYREANSRNDADWMKALIEQTKPCCVPTQLEHFSVVLVWSNWDMQVVDMGQLLVNQCGCL